MSYRPYKSMRVICWGNSLIVCSLDGASGVSKESSHLSIHRRGPAGAPPAALPRRPGCCPSLFALFAHPEAHADAPTSRLLNMLVSRRPFCCAPVAFAHHRASLERHFAAPVPRDSRTAWPGVRFRFGWLGQESGSGLAGLAASNWV